MTNRDTPASPSLARSDTCQTCHFRASAADGVLVLSRPRNRSEATLNVIGRATAPAPQPDADRPPLGSLASPVVCRGTRMPRSCVWDTCDGHLVAMGRDLYQCAKCGTWFQLLAPETGFVYVGDLANDFDRETKTEWTM